MLSQKEFTDIFSELKEIFITQKDLLDEEKLSYNLRDDVEYYENNAFNFKVHENIIFIKDFLSEKFSECKKIFEGLDKIAIHSFILNCIFQQYNEQEIVFSKGKDCTEYYFLLFGDISLYSDKKEDESSKLLKTISGGLVFGHKVKDKLQYYAYSQSLVSILTIDKCFLSKLINSTNERKEKTKDKYLKKFFPKYRTLSEDSLTTNRKYFFKHEFTKGSKLIIDGEFDEYIYIILLGTCAAIKKCKKIHGLTEKLGEKIKSHIVLEEYSNFFIKKEEIL